MSITSAASLVDVLRAYRILDQTQLDKVNRALQERAPDPRALAKELLQQGWLTPFQANQLLNGRGAELVLGEYLLLDRLGEGGMGQVFKARHRLMNRIVAVKVIRKERLANADAVQRFHREIQMAAQLDHPHLVRAHDAAQVGDTHFLVMEYAEGVSVQQLVRKSGPLPVGQACTYIHQASLGLQHASERKMVHRDIKPSNLQVTAQGRVVKILDMGLARSHAAEGGAGIKAELTQACTIMGTPDFIAPEQIADPRRVDIRADIYSLGCTFYFMLAGRPPFPDGAWEEKLVSHRKVEPQPIEQVRSDVPAALGAVLRKMMAKRPEDRYAAPAAVAEALSQFCGLNSPVPAVAAAPGVKAQPAPLPAGPAAAPAPAPVAASLVNPGSYEPGWTLELGSTVSPAAAASTQGQSPALLAAPTILGPGPQQPTLSPPAAGAVPPSTSGPSASAPRARQILNQLIPAVQKNFLLLAGTAAGLLILLLLVILFWPKGGNTDSKSGNSEAKGPGQPGQPRVLINENFRKPFEQKRALPEGWSGDAFRVVKVDDETCLEVSTGTLDPRSPFQFPPRKPSFVSLPPVNLNGNFFIEGVFFMERNTYMTAGMKGLHHLTIRLENSKSNAILPVVIDQTGFILIGDDTRNAPPNYKPYLPTKFLVTRKGTHLSVILNNELVADKNMGEATEYDTFKLGLTEGGGGVKTGECRLYRLTVGTLGADGSVPDSGGALPRVPVSDPRRKGK